MSTIMHNHNVMSVIQYSFQNVALLPNPRSTPKSVGIDDLHMYILHSKQMVKLRLIQCILGLG